MRVLLVIFILCGIVLIFAFEASKAFIDYDECRELGGNMGFCARNYPGD